MINRLFRILTIIFIALAILNCEENIQPKSDFVEEYSANLIMRGDTNFHILTITKSYDVEGFDPNSYEGNLFVQNAQAELIYNNKIYSFINSALVAGPNIIDDKGYDYYYLSNLEIEPNAKMELLVTLPDGKTLTSSTQAPQYNFVTFLNSDRIIPPNQNKGNFYIEWKGSQQDLDFEDLVFQPKLEIIYSKRNDNFTQNYSYIVPLRKESKADGISYTYPAVSNKKWETWSMDIIDDSFRQISAEDSIKSNYKIKQVHAVLLVFDKNLGNYFAALQTFLDTYSVRVNEPDVSNIEGGFGVFGSYITEELKIDAFSYYIQSFGYLTRNSN
ncbi:MAG: DUF4249 family protein [Melioribacteraceae bacterium]|nr:DUF4249 family protein [Melioribacteraceae bacterium]